MKLFNRGAKKIISPLTVDDGRFNRKRRIFLIIYRTVLLVIKLSQKKLIS